MSIMIRVRAAGAVVVAACSGVMKTTPPAVSDAALALVGARVLARQLRVMIRGKNLDSALLKAVLPRSRTGPFVRPGHWLSFLPQAPGENPSQPGTGAS